MSVETPSTEPLAAIAGYRATAVLRRRPREGAAYDAVGEDGRRVELWVVPARDQLYAARFLEEAKALAELRHDHLPRILDYGEADERLYLATEPTDGVGLQELIAENEGLPPMRAVRLLGEAADALDAAHAVGVLHARLSPSTVVVEERPLERALLEGFALGAASQGRHAKDDDIRAFARLMFECFTGSHPRGQTPATSLRPDLPPELDGVLARGLAPEKPSHRPRSAAELVADAARAMMDTAVPTTAPAPATEVVPETAPQPVYEPAPEVTREAAPEPVPEPAPAPSPSTALEPAPSRERVRVPLRSRLAGATIPLALAALVVAAAAVGGWIAGKPDSKANSPKKVSSGVVELAPPAGWREGRPSPSLGGLSLRDALSAGGASDGRVDAGIVPGTLPARVAERVGRSPGSPDAVRLGSLQAYVWRDLAERGSSSRITLFAAGTDAGLVALACRGAAPARARCERSAASLAVPGASPADLGDIGSWTRRLDRVMSRLATRRSSGRAGLRKASTPRGSAAAARRLSGSYSAAARSVTSQDAPVGADRAQREIDRSLRAISSSYRRLADATRRQRGARYRSARRSVSRGERSLKVTLSRL